MCKVLRFLVMVLLAFLTGLCGITTAFAETEEKVIVLSDRVGEVIDVGERERFELLQGIQGFKSAVYLQLPDGSYVLEITYVKEGEEAKRRIEQSERDIEMLRDYIEHYEEITGSKEARQVFDEKWKTSLPETKPEIKEEKRGMPLPEVEEAEEIQKVLTLGEEGSRIPGEIAAGCGGGCLGSGVGGIAGGIIYGILTRDPKWGENIGGPLVGMAVGYTVGCAIGVYYLGTKGNETGSFTATLGGSVLGAGTWIATVWLCHSIAKTNVPILNLVAFFGGPPIGATIGFNLTRRPKQPPPSGNSLINFRDGQLSLAFPAIYFKPNPIEGKTLVQNVDLVTVRF